MKKDYRSLHNFNLHFIFQEIHILVPSLQIIDHFKEMHLQFYSKFNILHVILIYEMSSSEGFFCVSKLSALMDFACAGCECY